MAQRILKNQTDSPIYINDLGAKLIPEYGELDFAQSFTLTQLSNSEDLLMALATNVVNKYSQYLVLNDGVRDLEADEAIDLIRNLQQRTNQTVDGDYKFVRTEISTVTGNSVIEKNLSVYMDAKQSFNKLFYIPVNRIWYIQSFGLTTDGLGMACFAYINENGQIEHPFVDVINDRDCTLALANVQGEKILTIENFSSEMNSLDVDQLYRIEDSLNPNITEIIKIKEIDFGNNTITTEVGLGNDYNIGSYIALIQKPIRTLSANAHTEVLAFNSPLKLVGTGTNAIKLGLHNLETVQDISITAFINGWSEPL